MFESLNTALEPLNSSKLFAGITMLILNVGAKYITVDFNKTQEAAVAMQQLAAHSNFTSQPTAKDIQSMVVQSLAALLV